MAIQAANIGLVHLIFPATEDFLGRNKFLWHKSSQIIQIKSHLAKHPTLVWLSNQLNTQLKWNGRDCDISIHGTTAFVVVMWWRSEIWFE